MKKTALFYICLCLAINVVAQTEFIYTPSGEKIYFKTRKDLVAIKSESPEKAKSLSHHLVFKSVIGNIDDMVFAAIDTIKTKADVLRKTADIKDIAYMLEYDDGTIQIPKNNVAVKL